MGATSQVGSPGEVPTSFATKGVGWSGRDDERRRRARLIITSPSRDVAEVSSPVSDVPPAVFVYGTLIPGNSRWWVLEPFAESWEEACAAGALYDTGRGYPAATFFGRGGAIRGVRVRLRPDLLDDAVARLDEVEGAGTLYRRVVVPTSHGDAMSYEWIGPTDGLRRLAEGWTSP